MACADRRSRSLLNIGMKLSAVLSRAKALAAKLIPVTSGDKAADISMRWARPIALMLITLMFVIGWSNPTSLLAFAQAIAVLPEAFWNVVYIVLGSLATTKLIRDIGQKK